MIKIVETNVKFLPINTNSRRGVNTLGSTKFCFKLWARENLLRKWLLNKRTQLWELSEQIGQGIWDSMQALLSCCTTKNVGIGLTALLTDILACRAAPATYDLSKTIRSLQYIQSQRPSDVKSCCCICDGPRVWGMRPVIEVLAPAPPQKVSLISGKCLFWL